MDLLALVVALILVHGLSLVSPGPDFFLVMRNSLLGTKRLGRLTASGIVLGNMMYVGLAAVFTFVISGEVGAAALSLIKLAGGGYLLYLGFNVLSSQSTPRRSLDATALPGSSSIGGARVFWTGFTSTALNGKAAVYFFSVVPQFLSSKHSILTNVILGLEIVLLSGLWFFGLAEISSLPSAQHALRKAFPIVNLLVGVVFVAFGGLMVAEFVRGIA